MQLYDASMIYMMQLYASLSYMMQLYDASMSYMMQLYDALCEPDDDI